jgi:N-acetylglucosamine malate deacetylase 1
MELNNILKGTKVVIIAPHADDEILGCGGLISKATALDLEIYILLGTLAGFKSLNGGFDSDHQQRRCEFESVMKSGYIKDYDIFDCDGTYHMKLDTIPISKLINWMEKDSKLGLHKLKPDIILIPSGQHSHQDHQAIYESCIAVLRTNPAFPILLSAEYEIPCTGQTGIPAFDPDLYIELTPKQLQNKTSLFSLYKSQVAKKPCGRSLEAIKIVAAMRGLESGHEFAEAFKILRVNLEATKK